MSSSDTAAKMIQETPNDKDAAYQLLGWSSNNNATSSSSTNQTTNANESTFRSAMHILLSSGEGQITFHTTSNANNNNENDNSNNNLRRDPMSITKGYFRLITCSL